MEVDDPVVEEVCSFLTAKLQIPTIDLFLFLDSRLSLEKPGQEHVCDSVPHQE